MCEHGDALPIVKLVLHMRGYGSHKVYSSGKTVASGGSAET